MKINIHFFVLMAIACITSLSDIIIYLLGIQYEIALILGLTICGVIFGSIIKKKKIILESNFEKIDIIFYILLASIFVIRIGVPDFTYDTRNYHIYLQENPFIDKINFDFFVRIEIFIYPLGDRMFYIFRHFLGYRLGTILTYYVCIIIYYQIKLVIKHISRDMNCIWVLLISLGAIFILAINQWIGTYYVDILSTTFALEMIVLALVLKENNDIEIKYLAYLIAIIVGISIGIKIINLFIEIPILIYFLKDLKKLKVKDIIICVLLILFPFAIYAIDNIIQTGNPIFPYLNTAFNSPYLEKFNYHDTNWGVDNFWKSLIWPIIVMIWPEKGYELEFENEVIFGIGFIVVLLFILVNLFKKEKRDNTFFISVITILMTIIWANCMMGYVRYGISLILLYWVITSIIMYNLSKKKDILRIGLPGLFLVLILLVYLKTILFTYAYMKFVPMNSYYNSYNYKTFCSNLSNIFKDSKNEKIHINGVWGKIGEDSAVLTLVREENTPIYNLQRSKLPLNEKTFKMYCDRIMNNNIYTFIDVNNIRQKVEALNENNFVISEFIKCYDNLSFADINNKYYLVRVEYNETQKNELAEEEDEFILNGHELTK